jgi:uncharacterized membrane protein YkoI
MRTRKPIVTTVLAATVIAGAAALAGGVTAMAGETSMPKDPAIAVQSQPVQPRKGLSMAEIVDRLAARGYTDIREIERERDVYEVKAQDKDGRRAKFYVDATTGERVEGERKEGQKRFWNKLKFWEQNADASRERDSDGRGGGDRR